MELEYSLQWLSRLPFNILWVQGNHENYNMIAEFPIEEWNGGKVRHIVRDKIILLERGQISLMNWKISCSTNTGILDIIIRTNS